MYVFAVNLLGLGIGPVAVGILSDNVFAGRFALQNAIATFMFAMAVLALAAAHIFFAPWPRGGRQLRRPPRPDPIPAAIEPSPVAIVRF